MAAFGAVRHYLEQRGLTAEVQEMQSTVNEAKVADDKHTRIASLILKKLRASSDRGCKVAVSNRPSLVVRTGGTVTLCRGHTITRPKLACGLLPAFQDEVEEGA